MSSQHNKRRNSSLVYEFLVKYISKCLVEGNEKSANEALKIVKAFYVPGTEVYKEYRLINALVNTTVSSEHVAASVLSEAKQAAKSHNTKTLDLEKTSLIHVINKRLGDPDLYEQHIENYKTHATAQGLLNMWRAGDSTLLERQASYEDQILQRLTRPQEQKVVNENNSSPGSNRLLFRVMLRKLNDKYKDTLLPEQKSLLKAYAFSAANNDDTVVKKMVQIKENLLEKIDTELKKEPEGYVSKKLQEARGEIQKAVPEQTDDCVANFMLYAKLKSELESEDR